MAGFEEVRIFKSAWFAKAAKKSGISDGALGKAMHQVLAGQADDLGGGVYKKRLAKNLYRSIILAKAKDFWVFEFLYAKQDMANISEGELHAFRQLAKAYANLEASQIDAMIAAKHWIEIPKPKQDEQA